MDKCFKNLLYFHFLNFLMKSKAITSDTPSTSGTSFIDFLKQIYSEQKIKKKKFIEKITKVIDDSQLSQILKEITDCFLYRNLIEENNFKIIKNILEDANNPKNKENFENKKITVENEESEDNIRKIENNTKIY